MGIFTYKTDEVLMEAYYGKKPEFAKIEKLLDVIIYKCNHLSEDAEINGSKEISQIEALFEKAFGMKQMNLTFYVYSTAMVVTSIKNRTVAGVNAFTYPSFISYFKSKKNGVVTDEDLVCNVFVDVNLVRMCKMTSGELMAVILHELGHCYNASLFSFLSRIPLTLNTDNIGQSISTTLYNIVSGIFAEEFDGFTDITRFDRFVNSLITSNNKVANIVTKLVSVLQNFFRMYNMRNPVIKMLAKKELPWPLALSMSLSPRSIFGYSDEKFSDSFATAYGYGPETVSIQYKFQTNKTLLVGNIGEKIPILNIGLDLVSIANSITILPIDEHPDAAIRIQSQINKLKRDLKDPNLDPKVKKELLDNLNEMEEYVNHITSTKENIKTGRIFTALYNKVMMKVFKGKLDIRELFEIVYNHEM